MSLTEIKDAIERRNLVSHIPMKVPNLISKCEICFFEEGFYEHRPLPNIVYSSDILSAICDLVGKQKNRHVAERV